MSLVVTVRLFFESGPNGKFFRATVAVETIKKKSFLNPGIRPSINKIFEEVLKNSIHLVTRTGSSSQILAGLTPQ